MSRVALPTRPRRWRATEVVQTSAMDCGPAALKSLLEGHHIPVSYGRLREACQTGVDGSSIDTLEGVAGQLGLRAEQVMIPADHLLLPQARALPALVVVRQPDGAPHFVVLWRVLGPWLQVMDPALGRRWLRADRWRANLYQHSTAVPADAWRAWAASDDCQAPLQQRLRRLGASAAQARALREGALADAGWFSLGALDAAVRLVQALHDAGAVARGRAALALLRSLQARACAQADDIFAVLPAAWWSVTPDPDSLALGALHLQLRGAVLLRILGRTDNVLKARPPDDADAAPPLSAELQAALREPPPAPLRAAWALLRQDGLLAPLALAGAVVLAAAALLTETVLLRGLLDLTAQLGQASHRLLAWAALLAFAVLLLALEVPIVRESMRLGRQLEARLRLALLAKLPRLGDRYFQSRSVSDMAERSHSLQALRQLPALGLSLLQALAELLMTLLGLAWLAPASLWPALLLVLLAVGLPLLWQPLLAEREARQRSHLAALNGVLLDALLGAVPLRSHHAGLAVRREHEGLLLDWAQVAAGQRRLALVGSGLLQLAGTLLAGGLLVQHLLRAGGVSGGDLLLVYWTLKLPAIAGQVGGLAQQLPAQRNGLLRLLEPLSAPELAGAAPGAATPQAQAHAVSVQIDGGCVLAAGHTLLQDLRLHIQPGEQVAVVGPSGAGKSSLLGLLLGWHTLADGTLQVDGRPLDADGLAALRRATAWVDPGVQLWNRTLLDNLHRADGADDTAGAEAAPLGEVLAAADLQRVLQNLDDGLQTPLGEGGARLSGGEGQRVRLARALGQTGVRLVLLDEPFRGLDRGQRATLLGRARRWWAGATMLCVTHDVGETLAFDRVLVVDGGRIVEDGVPRVLAAQPSCYAQLLAAEQAVRQQAWQGTAWRRLRLAGGRLEADVPAGPAAAAASPTPSLGSADGGAGEARLRVIH